MIEITLPGEFFAAHTHKKKKKSTHLLWKERLCILFLAMPQAFVCLVKLLKFSLLDFSYCSDTDHDAACL